MDPHSMRNVGQVLSPERSAAVESGLRWTSDSRVPCALANC